jgi:hypothetical protein
MGTVFLVAFLPETPVGAASTQIFEVGAPVVFQYQLGEALQSPTPADINHDPSKPSSPDTSIVTVHVGDHTLYVPGNYINRFDGFQFKMGYLHIHALLPCLLPETPDNAAEFHQNHWANVLDARLSVWDTHYLIGANLLAARMADNKKFEYLMPGNAYDAEHTFAVPGTDFYLYKDNMISGDIFFTNSLTTMFVLQCTRQIMGPFPFCESRSVIEISLLLEYGYSRSFVDKSLEQGLYIDNAIHKLFQLFLSPESATTTKNTGVCK